MNIKINDKQSKIVKIENYDRTVSISVNYGEQACIVKITEHGKDQTITLSGQAAQLLATLCASWRSLPSNTANEYGVSVSR